MKTKTNKYIHNKRFFYLFFTMAFTTVVLESCNSKEDPLNIPLEEVPILQQNTPLEKEVKKIYDTYNVRFDYKWNRYAFARNSIADPPSIDDVLPYIEIFNELYFNAISKVSSSNFVRDESPLTIFLLGSGINYGGLLSFGEVTAGQAGNIQPNRLTLGGLTLFGEIIRAKSDSLFLEYIFDYRLGSYPHHGGEVGFIYHEYNHFIDSKRGIPKGFEEITFEGYLRGTNAYRFLTDEDARLQGFMLAYGMQNESEDFSTYVQVMVWRSREFIEKTLLSERRSSEATIQKYKLVYEYYNNLGLDLFKLRDYIHSDEMREKILNIKHKYDGTL